ncbi:CBS domain-containing protein [Hymenobacter mucosus]|uniref:CBS domain-containing protein n=1 Tax=Hymenobacter mucosus TaxID=1411120 RepID=A0A238XZB6_9BACT|nr:CBS domain-containing protein [Hymenobacter mucosus]SNR63871.1 CBS domain-containing protein [Hymenobacter mucosus]
MEITIDEKLEEVNTLISEGRSPSVTVRELLSWVLAERRGYVVVTLIRLKLKRHNLITLPDFESAYLDSEIEFVHHTYTDDETSQDTSDTVPETDNDADQPDISEPVALGRYSKIEPAYKISRLEAANRSPVYVSPDSDLEHAITIMLANRFSQLPVMTNEREVKGIISWASIGSRMALGKRDSLVREFMEPHQEMRHNDSIISAINIVNQHDYVLVRKDDKRISGIVTASDLNFQFQQISESFMLLSEIENYIRRLLEPKFNVELLNTAKDPNDTERTIESVSDLTFGEYIRLLENPERWNMLNLAISRKIFCEKIDQTRKIRNDVMHFDPDGIRPEDLKSLHDFSIFLQKLHSFNLI